jgi:hypothetical protein
MPSLAVIPYEGTPREWWEARGAVSVRVPRRLLLGSVLRAERATVPPVMVVDSVDGELVELLSRTPRVSSTAIVARAPRPRDEWGEALSAQVRRLPFMTSPDAVRMLGDEVSDWWRLRRGLLSAYLPKLGQEWQDAVDARLCELEAPRGWGAPLVVSVRTLLDGARLWGGWRATPEDVAARDAAPFAGLSWTVFARLARAWDAAHDDSLLLEYNSFWAAVRREACTEWNRMDETGEYFVGAWRAPEGSEERDNAFHLTFDRNVAALWALPYPKTVVLEALRLWCHEGVAHTRIVCEWTRRKRAQIAEVADAERSTVVLARLQGGG